MIVGLLSQADSATGFDATVGRSRRRVLLRGVRWVAFRASAVGVVLIGVTWRNDLHSDGFAIVVALAVFAMRLGAIRFG